MKKIMIMLAIGGVAIAANAASVNWGGYISNGADANQTAQAGTVFNAIYIGSNDFTSLFNTFVYDKTTGLVGTGTGENFTAAAGQTLLGTHTMTASEAEAYEFQDIVRRADAAGGVNGNWLVTMFDATTPDNFWVGQYTVAGASDSTGAASMVDTDWNIGTTMYSGVTASAPVPEPTSGLLMLVGLAGLALKRKRA